MPIMTDGPVMEPENKGIDEFHVGYGTSLAATARQTFEDSPVHQLFDINEMEKASGRSPDLSDIGSPFPSTGPGISEDVKPAEPNIDMIDAIDRVKKAGLAPQLKLPDQPDIPPAQLAIMMDRARRRQELETTIDRGPQGFVPSALSVGTSFLVGAADPLNVASAFIPVMGELRYGKLLASAGDSMAARLAVRAGVGAANGVVGQAALEPLDWWSHTQDGRDFGMADVLHNLMFGAALGGGLHAGGGFISDAYRGAKGRPLYPFGPGEPMENVQGTHVPAAVLAEEGVSADALHDHLGDLMTRPEAPQAEPERVPGEAVDTARTTVDINGERTTIDTDLAAVRAAAMEETAPPSPAVMTINDLPQRAHEDAMRGAIANLIEGEPVRSGEMLEAAAQTDPRIRESFEAFHGSPHDFDRFDINKIGSGEGAQAYGHGLYFAENEKVARGYQRTVSDKAFVDKVAELYDEGHSPDDAWAEIKDHWSEFTPGEQRLMTALEKDDWLGFDYPHQAVSAALRELKAFDVSDETKAAVRAIGNMYRVKIAADHEHFLDWDRPLKDQPRALAAIEAIWAKMGEPSENWQQMSAAQAYDRLAKHVGGEGASQEMHSAGIPGIKYLDQGSRPGPGAMTSAGMKLQEPPKTRNFVVFDDKHIEITHKNGEPVKREQIQRSQHVEPKAPRGRAAADPQTWSLFEFLSHEGGLKPDPELQAIFGTAKGPFVPSFGPLVRPAGRTLDDALRLAKDHGYMFDAADVTGAEGRLTPNDLLDRLAEENSGRKQYRNDQTFATKAQDVAAMEREKHEIISALHDEIESGTGIKGSKIDPRLEDRVVEIMTREGEHDVLAAYERAIMEDEERYNAETGQQGGRDQPVAGRDIPDDARAASPGGGAAEERGAAAGNAGAGAGANAGGQSRSAGRGNGAAPQTQLGRDAAWRQLAQPKPEFDDPDVIAASKEADAAKLPPTKLDERVAAAEKADAFAKQMYDMFAHRLPEGDRQRLDDLIKSIDDDHEAREIATVRAGSCLFGVL